MYEHVFDKKVFNDTDKTIVSNNKIVTTEQV